MDFLMALILEYGYYLVFLGTLLEGETVVALAGFLSYQGHMKLEIIIPIAVVGATIGDHIFFYLGRYKGRTILAKHPNWHGRVEKISVWLERHQNLLIFGSRFLYGFRAITPIVLGTSKVSAFRFTMLNVLGAVVWAVFFTLCGYLFGDAIGRFLGNIKKIEGLLVAGIILAMIVIQGGFWVRSRKKNKVQKELLQ